MPRLRLAPALAGVAGVLAALVAGVNPFITGVAAALALSAYLASRPAVAALAAGLGALSDALLLHGAPRWEALVIFGVALATLGVAYRRSQRQTP